MLRHYYSSPLDSGGPATVAAAAAGGGVRETTTLEGVLRTIDSVTIEEDESLIRGKLLRIQVQAACYV